ncbi:hypothetical protein ACFX13_019860 [Malus domestica]
MKRAIFAYLQSRGICKTWWWRRLCGFWMSNSDLGFGFRTMWKNMGGEIDLDEQVDSNCSNKETSGTRRSGLEQEGGGGGGKLR